MEKPNDKGNDMIRITIIKVQMRRVAFRTLKVLEIEHCVVFLILNEGLQGK